MTKQKPATGHAESDDIQKSRAHPILHGGKMKITPRQLRKIIKEVIDIRFKPGTSEKEKQKMLHGLLKMLGVGEDRQ